VSRRSARTVQEPQGQPVGAISMRQALTDPGTAQQRTGRPKLAHVDRRPGRDHGRAALCLRAGDPRAAHRTATRARPAR
jgi:hypothetical protein